MLPLDHQRYWVVTINCKRECCLGWLILSFSTSAYKLKKHLCVVFAFGLYRFVTILSHKLKAKVESP